MSTESPSTPFGKSRGTLIAGGLLSLIVGLMAMSFPQLFSIAIAQLLGAFILVSGLISLFLAVTGKHQGHRVIEGLSAIIRIAAGTALFVCVQSGIAVITLIFAIFLIIEGLMFCIGSFKLRAHPGWIWTFFNGLAALILGAMVYSRWPSDAHWVLGLFFGINLLFSGSSLLALGLSAPRPAKA